MKSGWVVIWEMFVLPTVAHRSPQSSIAAKISIIWINMQFESFSKCNFEQLSHSMFCKNIARLASIQGQQVSLATAKLSVFLQKIQRESCSKLIFEQLSHSMSCGNIDGLAVIKENVFLTTKVTNHILGIWPLQKTRPNDFWMLVPKTPRDFQH